MNLIASLLLMIMTVTDVLSMEYASYSYDVKDSDPIVTKKVDSPFPLSFEIQTTISTQTIRPSNVVQIPQLSSEQKLYKKAFENGFVSKLRGYKQVVEKQLSVDGLPKSKRIALKKNQEYLNALLAKKGINVLETIQQCQSVEDAIHYYKQLQRLSSVDIAIVENARVSLEGKKNFSKAMLEKLNQESFSRAKVQTTLKSTEQPRTYRGMSEHEFKNNDLATSQVVISQTTDMIPTTHIHSDSFESQKTELNKIVNGFTEHAVAKLSYIAEHPSEYMQDIIQSNLELAKKSGSLMLDVYSQPEELYVSEYQMAQYEASVKQRAEAIAQTYNQLCQTITHMSWEEFGGALAELAIDYALFKGAGKSLSLIKNARIASIIKENTLLAKIHHSLEKSLLKHPEMITPEGIAVKGVKAIEQAEIAEENLLQAMSAEHKINKCKDSIINNKYTFKNGVFNNREQHPLVGNSRKSACPKDGQHALDNSLQIKNLDKPRRVAISNNEFVVLDKTMEGDWHGHVRSWEELTDNMQNTLIKADLVTHRGKIIK